MSRLAAIAGALLLAACQTTAETGGANALYGEELDAALGLYGPYAEYLMLDGKPTYVWRRNFQTADQNYFCELRVETGFRRTISRSVMQGFPDACRLFSVSYKAARNN